ncbi:D-hexose-6-phosphate mutarotase [Nissabacter sp. SGAir0207]|uniref:D-hexose-6-phosphate mutarotase n=1 Tax=Nissabacter sp. SGAir0207 TaxID=2126321 RepID=UPI0010CD2BB2|nr:D-hexose-6-phosphate mutarotase [Nissabacter sp. SGAir0207]QCR36026.1 D-hexose-6-phosphate mutarotase [Nissabacter sp. SGAir0207]
MNQHIFTLPVIKPITATISERQLDQLPVIVVDHPLCHAAVALQGAHLLAWQPAGEQPVLWLSANSAYEPGTAIRGGVPICWPWFGPAGKPSHGFARNMPWEFTDHSETPEGVTLTFTLKDNPQSRKLWPHAFTLVARFTLGATCHIELESSGDFTTTAALHSYFEIGDIDAVAVRGLGNHYIDKVRDGIEGEQQGDLTFPGRVDRVYTQPQATSLILDSALNREIEVEHHQHSDVIAWNPGAELSASMADMADDSYKTMVCVETGCVSTPQVSKPGQPARLATTLRVRRPA